MSKKNPTKEAVESSKPDKGLRMNQLVAATGLPKSTLLYYVEQGLLPKPVKTSPNMAYYDPVCVERAGMIKNLQSQHRLPLGKIKILLEAAEQGQDLAPLLALTQEVFGPAQEELMDTKHFLVATGMEPEQLEGLLASELILPLEPGRFDQQDLAMARVYMRGWNAGLQLGDAEYYVRLGKQIVEQEMRLRNRVTRNLPTAQDAEATLAMVQAARATRAYVIDRLFQHRIAAMGGLKDHQLPPEDGDEQDS
ncbi:MAG: MerR family transcriptional regulator [Desulfarculaceae bacterium]|nr:MerR family transcriptional regulator [Desulfarculaceae bacterium]MCF8072980.1 MerR family transcriptional regulator [Desulfarculaceae bacterium]MCF8100724.1 MerR family transcriptional regulator [Desulfarculaceae bacterium]MCF8115462.1 MerR family transcriptional regulator [Desulfarculaceae bacterium]